MLCAGPTRMGHWSRVRRKCLAAGMTLRQNGDDEGAFSFDPSNRTQAALAIKLAGARPKRRLSPEHRAKLLAANRHTQFLAGHMVLIGGSKAEIASRNDAVA
jgi:hypothetical protein